MPTAKISFLQLDICWRAPHFLQDGSRGCKPFLVTSVRSLSHAYQLAAERSVVTFVNLVIAPNTMFILSVDFLEPQLLLIEQITVVLSFFWKSKSRCAHRIVSSSRQSHQTWHIIH